MNQSASEETLGSRLRAMMLDTLVGIKLTSDSLDLETPDADAQDLTSKLPPPDSGSGPGQSLSMTSCSSSSNKSTCCNNTTQFLNDPGAVTTVATTAPTTPESEFIMPNLESIKPDRKSSGRGLTANPELAAATVDFTKLSHESDEIAESQSEISDGDGQVEESDCDLRTVALDRIVADLDISGNHDKTLEILTHGLNRVTQCGGDLVNFSDSVSISEDLLVIEPHVSVVEGPGSAVIRERLITLQRQLRMLRMVMMGTKLESKANENNAAEERRLQAEIAQEWAKLDQAEDLWE